MQQRAKAGGHGCGGDGCLKAVVADLRTAFGFWTEEWERDLAKIDEADDHDRWERRAFDVWSFMHGFLLAAQPASKEVGVEVERARDALLDRINERRAARLVADFQAPGREAA